jgi:hypothetical protein
MLRNSLLALMTGRVLAAGLALQGCAEFAATPTPGETAGQLFCQIAKSDGTSQVVGVINASVPGAVVVTGVLQAVVFAECALAAESAGAVTGVPVSPPTAPVGSVAITPPVQTPAA